MFVPTPKQKIAWLPWKQIASLWSFHQELAIFIMSNRKYNSSFPKWSFNPKRVSIPRLHRLHQFLFGSWIELVRESDTPFYPLIPSWNDIFWGIPWYGRIQTSYCRCHSSCISWWYPVLSCVLKSGQWSIFSFIGPKWMENNCYLMVI